MIFSGWYQKALLKQCLFCVILSEKTLKGVARWKQYLFEQLLKQTGAQLSN